jgi:hypothetical protein
MTFQEKLSNYLKASYPLLYIQTHEEIRICNDIHQAFKNRDKIQVYEWDCNQLLQKREKSDTISNVNATAGLKEIIKVISSLGSDDQRCIVILKDFPSIY